MPTSYSESLLLQALTVQYLRKSAILSACYSGENSSERRWTEPACRPALAGIIFHTQRNASCSMVLIFFPLPQKHVSQFSESPLGENAVGLLVAIMPPPFFSQHLLAENTCSLLPSPKRHRVSTRKESTMSSRNTDGVALIVGVS